jgi:outer membrane protein
MSSTPLRRSLSRLVSLAGLALATLVAAPAMAQGEPTGDKPEPQSGKGEKADKAERSDSDAPHIAVIDLARAIADTEDGIRVKAELQELYDVRQQDYESKEKALADAKAEYDDLAKSGKAKDSTLRKKLAALEKMAYDLQVTQYNFRREMQQKEYSLMQPIIKQMMVLVRRLAGQNNYDMVLNKEAVPFYRNDLDITDRVVQMYNAAQAASPDEKPATKPKKGNGAGKGKGTGKGKGAGKKGDAKKGARRSEKRATRRT